MVKGSPFRAFLRLGDVLATISMIGSFVIRLDGPRRGPFVCTLTIGVDSTASQGAWEFVAPWPPSAGSLLRALATTQERFYDRNHRYARRMRELESLRMPDGWHATILTGSARRYRIRLEPPARESEGTVCSLWGGRRDAQTIEPFDIDCHRAHRSR